MVSHAHAVCSKGLHIAMIATTVETDKPELEIKPAQDMIGPVLEMFVQISPIMQPTDDGKGDNVSNLLTYSSLSPAHTTLHLISKVPVKTY
jgi:Rab GDP dissociation inhibitor